MSETIATWEFGSINALLSHAMNLHSKRQETHYLYIHTKGLNVDNGDYVAKWFWRKNLENWLVVRHEYCRWLLDNGFDTIGVNATNHGPENAEQARVNPSHAWHYSGNFWWATHSYLSTLKPLQTDTLIDHVVRLKAENFILSQMPNMCAANIHQDENVHVYSVEQIPRVDLNLMPNLRVLKP